MLTFANRIKGSFTKFTGIPSTWLTFLHIKEVLEYIIQVFFLSTSQTPEHNASPCQRLHSERGHRCSLDHNLQPSNAWTNALWRIRQTPCSTRPNLDSRLWALRSGEATPWRWRSERKRLQFPDKIYFIVHGIRWPWRRCRHIEERLGADMATRFDL